MDKLMQGEQVRIGDDWYVVIYHLPRLLYDKSGKHIDLILDRSGVVSYADSHDVDETGPLVRHDAYDPALDV